MLEPISSLRKIQALRAQRKTLDTQVYHTRLELQKLRSELKRRAAGETTPPEDDTQVRQLRQRVADLEATRREIGDALNEVQESTERAKRSSEVVEALRGQIDGLGAQIEALRRERDEPGQHDDPDGSKRRELDIRVRALTEQLERLQGELGRASDDAGDDQRGADRARERRRGLEREREAVTEQIAKSQAALGEIARLRPPGVDDVLERINAKEADHLRLQDALVKGRADLHGAIGGLYVDPHPANGVARLDDDVPFLLMPVRIETRFVGTNAVREMWLRIYPDDIAIHTHEETLTGDEVADGTAYWTALFGASSAGGEAGEDRKKAAWTKLVALYPPQRAAWVALQTKPTNWSADLSGVPDADALVFPVHDATKTNAWSRAPRTNVLPDKFVVLLYEGGAVVNEIPGRLIPDELFVGPDPFDAKDAFQTKGMKLGFGADYDWMSDFDRAVDLGLGFRIPLTGRQVTEGFEKVLVLGVCLSSSETECQVMVEQLVDNHHYSPKGFSIVPQGAPTNNTDQNGSGYTRNDPFGSTSYLVEAGKALFDENDDCDGRTLADALGIDYAPLQNVMHADARDYREAVAMNQALYPGTLGYYFGTMMQPLIDADAQGELRDFFVHHVTGRGPLPAIRVGDQPYGVLLTSDFLKWEESRSGIFRQSAFYPTLLKVLRKYQEIWNGMLQDLSFVGKTNSDPSTVLMDVLGLQAGSVAFAQRNAYSTDDLIDQANFQAEGRFVEDLRKSYRSKDTLLLFLHQLGARISEDDGRLRIPQILRLVYHHRTTELDPANLIDGVPLSEDRLIRNYDEAAGKNYLHWLAEATSATVLERQDFGAGVPAPNSLLYLMLRKALLDQLHNAAARWMEDRGVSVAETSLVRNFMNIRPAPSLSKWEVMKAPVGVAEANSPAARLTVAEHLLGSTRPAEAGFLNEVRAAIAELAALPTARLERCFTEHLDTCTYRLDAWQAGLFHMRLQEQRGVSVDGARAQRRKGIHLGAYGWVENVKPSSTRQLVREKVHPKLQPPDGAPLYEYTDNGGFVHAPSLNHASAAAVLRSGYMAHADALHRDVMAVNLSSERVRRALAVLQGIRQEQTLEALLGYQFERGLHDRASANNALNLNLYIYTFRDLYPYEQHRVKQQGSDEADADYTPQVSIAASNVVNGVRLAEASAAELDVVLGGIAGLTTAEREAIVAERDKLSDTLDAVKDLLLSESVYQLVQGNFDRTSATVNALQEARIPAEIQVVDTPRSSHFGFTNRVTIQFEQLDPSAPASNPWFPIPMTPRARMEPGTNKWLSEILGDPHALLCSIGTRQPDGTLTNAATVSVDQLEVQPIDLVYMAGIELNTGKAEDDEEARTAVSEIESRVAFVYRRDQGVADDVPVGIEFLKPANVAGSRTLGEMLPILRMLRSLLVESRPLQAEDFNPPAKKSLSDLANPKGYDLADLTARVNAARAVLGALVTALGNVPLQTQIRQSDGSMKAVTSLLEAVVELDLANAQFADGPLTFTSTAALQLRQFMLDAANHGLAYAFPSAVSPATDAEKVPLLEQARSVLHRLSAAVGRAAALVADLKPDATVETRVTAHLDAGKQLFGEAFAIIPLFVYNNEADILQSHADEAQLLGHAATQLQMSFPADEWLQNVAHVRPKLARWDYVRTLHETLNASTLALRPVQLPFRAKDSWVAVEFPETYDTLDEDGNPTTVPFTISNDTLSITVHGAHAFVAGAKQGGLLIDDWTEVIPTRAETTGIAFNHNQPNAMPPQALLLAVAPKITGHWEWSSLVGVLEDTLLRAKLRAVEPKLLDMQEKPELSVLLPSLLASFSEYDLDISLDYRLNLLSVLLEHPIKTASSRPNS
jgi:hypothetical protein